MSISRDDLRKYDYDQVKRFYDHGMIRQADWDWYRHVWRNGVVRYSNVALEFQHRTETEKAACPICMAEGAKALRVLLTPIQRGMSGYDTGLRWSVSVEHPDGFRALVESYDTHTEALACLRSESMRLQAPAYKLSAGEKKQELLFDCGKEAPPKCCENDGANCADHNAPGVTR